MVHPQREATYSVSQLCGEIREFLTEAFPEVWVSGEVQRLFTSRAGHVYMELVEKGNDDEIVGKLDAVLWRSHARRVRSELEAAGEELAEGREIRCRGRIDFYPAGGRLQLAITEVDPEFTVGRLAIRRRQTLEALGRADLLERNGELPLDPVPLDLALVTSHESAAYHDFVKTLEESGFGFRVLFVHASVQGATAERELVSALGFASSRPVDCIVLVRGGGSRSDLAVFDSLAVAEAVARSPRPVLTGLGHEIDRSVADIVAHSAFKTPTKVAESLVARVAGAERDLERIAVSLRHHGLGHVRRGRQMLGRAERGFDLVRLRMANRGERLGQLAQRLARAAHATVSRRGRERTVLVERLLRATPRLLARRRLAAGSLAERLAPAAGRRLVTATAAVESVGRLCDGLSPERTMARGFSVTRDADGRLIRAATQVRSGDRIATTLADGSLSSRVEDG